MCVAIGIFCLYSLLLLLLSISFAFRLSSYSIAQYYTVCTLAIYENIKSDLVDSRGYNLRHSVEIAVAAAVVVVDVENSSIHMSMSE